jgi:hypothetical protein
MRRNVAWVAVVTSALLVAAPANSAQPRKIHLAWHGAPWVDIVVRTGKQSISPTPASGNDVVAYVPADTKLVAIDITQKINGSLDSYTLRIQLTSEELGRFVIPRPTVLQCSPSTLALLNLRQTTALAALDSALRARVLLRPPNACGTDSHTPLEERLKDRMQDVETALRRQVRISDPKK